MCVLCVCRYNQCMGGVDRCDQLRGTFSMEKVLKTKYWYKKLWLGVMGVMLANAYLLWKSSLHQAAKKTNFHFEFLNSLMGSLMGPPLHGLRQTPPAQSDELRLNNDVAHYLEKMPDASPSKKQKQKSLRCVLCQREGLESRTSCRCDRCLVSLCSPHTGRSCFRLYHTLQTLPTPAKTNSKTRTPPKPKSNKRVGRPQKSPVSSP